MPIYEYHCEECESDIEVIQKFSESPLTECPKCNGSVQRITSQSAFVLKGGGWYKEGYSNSKSVTNTEKSAAKPKAKSAAPQAG